MLLYYFVSNVWLFLLVWVLVYLSDYTLTIWYKRLYTRVLSPYIEYEGSLEITPVFQKDVDAGRLFSRAFLLRLLLSLPLVYAIWWISVMGLGIYEPYFILMGGLLLREAAVHLRHFRNIAMALFVQRTGGMQGRVWYSRPLMLDVSAVDLWSFALLYFILALAMNSWFLIGGTLACLLTGFQHWQYARKAARSGLSPSTVGR